VNYRIKYIDKHQDSGELIIDAPDVKTAIDSAVEQLPDHTVLLSALPIKL